MKRKQRLYFQIRSHLWVLAARISASFGADIIQSAILGFPKKKKKTRFFKAKLEFLTLLIYWGRAPRNRLDV